MVCSLQKGSNSIVNTTTGHTQAYRTDPVTAELQFTEA